MLRDLLRNEDQPVGHKRVRRLMRQMGIEALYRKPNTSGRQAAHLIYPYMLRRLSIERPNHVWVTDITCISMRQGLVHSLVIVDWYSFQVLWPGACRSRIPLALYRDIEGSDQALRYAANRLTHQGNQVHQQRIHRTTQGERHTYQHRWQGCWRDNVFVERLWRTIKYDVVYLKAYESVSHDIVSLGQFIPFYKNRQLHQAFSGKMPDMIYFANLPQGNLAA